MAEDGSLVGCEANWQITVCPPWECGEPDDGGIQSWSRWRHNKRLGGSQNIKVTPRGQLRSDEELAAFSILALHPQAQIAKLPEQGNPDFEVTLPDGQRALAEVTMHTDGDRRALVRSSELHPCPKLANVWHVVLVDNRFVENYRDGNAFSVRSVQKTLAAALARTEAEGSQLDDYRQVAKLCEDEINWAWQWERGSYQSIDPPLSVTVVHREPVDGDGGVVLSTALVAFNFSQVVDAKGLVSAIQQETANKLDRNQWGDTTDWKWLLIVLDDSKAADDLLGAFEFDDHQHDFTDIAFPGLEEVWAIAFEDGNLTILRFTNSVHECHQNLPVPAAPKQRPRVARWSQSWPKPASSQPTTTASKTS
ncbi:hypothetical protein [Candidatus Poriferisocius sp.]|uniref:hypothetical protein n=1 Tax=Candidatus Poriferisocius sp. TaxID=3101276 RepID=UPI003B01A34F